MPTSTTYNCLPTRTMEQSMEPRSTDRPRRLEVVRTHVPSPDATDIIETMPSSDLPREDNPRPNFTPSRADPYSPFFIPDSILTNCPTPTTTDTDITTLAPNDCPILTLPNELLTEIFHHVKIPYFQVCLALTCKTMGRVARVKGVMAPWRGYRDKDGLFRLLERKAWIPRSLRLCRACFVFMPRDPNYWSDKISGEMEYDKRDTNWLDIFNFLHEDCFGSHSCPRCTVKGYRSISSETTYKAYMQKVIGPYPEEWEEVCPDVCRRIDQP